MSVTDILGGLKGKVLDASSLGLLKHTYSLQEEVIKQLRANNELLQEKVDSLRAENASLKGAVDELRQRAPAAEAIPEISWLSPDARIVLRAYLDADSASLFRSDIIAQTKIGDIRLGAVYTELHEGGILTLGKGKAGKGISYALTNKGKSVLAGLI